MTDTRRCDPPERLRDDAEEWRAVEAARDAHNKRAGDLPGHRYPVWESLSPDMQAELIHRALLAAREDGRGE